MPPKRKAPASVSRKSTRQGSKNAIAALEKAQKELEAAKANAKSAGNSTKTVKPTVTEETTGGKKRKRAISQIEKVTADEEQDAPHVAKKVKTSYAKKTKDAPTALKPKKQKIQQSDEKYRGDDESSNDMEFTQVVQNSRPKKATLTIVKKAPRKTYKLEQMVSEEDNHEEEEEEEEEDGEEEDDDEDADETEDIEEITQLTTVMDGISLKGRQKKKPVQEAKPKAAAPKPKPKPQAKAKVTGRVTKGGAVTKPKPKPAPKRNTRRGARQKKEDEEEEEEEEEEEKEEEEEEGDEEDEEDEDDDNEEETANVPATAPTGAVANKRRSKRAKALPRRDYAAMHRGMADDDDKEETKAQPKKQARARGKPKVEVMEEDEEDDDDDDEDDNEEDYDEDDEEEINLPPAGPPKPKPTTFAQLMGDTLDEFKKPGQSMDHLLAFANKKAKKWDEAKADPAKKAAMSADEQARMDKAGKGLRNVAARSQSAKSTGKGKSDKSKNLENSPEENDGFEAPKRVWDYNWKDKLPGFPGTISANLKKGPKISSNFDLQRTAGDGKGPLPYIDKRHYDALWKQILEPNNNGPFANYMPPQWDESDGIQTEHWDHVNQQLNDDHLRILRLHDDFAKKSTVWFSYGSVQIPKK